MPPESARTHNPWWSNQRNRRGYGHALAWQLAGWAAHGKICGVEIGMATTIDRAGRIVIPKAVRAAAHLEPGTRVRFRVTSSGVVEIEPEPLSVVLELRGRFTVAVPADDRPALKQADVNRTVAEMRADGGKSL